MSYIKTCVYIFTVSVLISLVLTYSSIITIIQTTKDNTERVLDSFVIENSTYIFNSIKNGNDFTPEIDPWYFVCKFYTDGTLDFDGNYFYNKDADGRNIYKLTVPQTSFAVDNTLNLTCTFNLFIPLEFAGKQVAELRIPIKVNSRYNLKT